MAVTASAKFNEVLLSPVLLSIANLAVDSVLGIPAVVGRYYGNVALLWSRCVHSGSISPFMPVVGGCSYTEKNKQTVRHQSGGHKVFSGVLYKWMTCMVWCVCVRVHV